VGSVCLASDFFNESGTYQTMMPDFESSSSASPDEMQPHSAELLAELA
jgi:hypothetical protein